MADTKGAQSKKGAKKSQQPTKSVNTVKQITKFETQQQKLSDQLSEAQKNLADSLQSRREELLSLRADAKKDYDVKDDALKAELAERAAKLYADFDAADLILRTELDEVNKKLGLDEKPAPVVSGEPLEGEFEFEYYDVKQPKGLGLETEFWSQLCQCRFEPTSLDQYVVLALANAAGQELHKSVIASVAVAMGHESNSADFEQSVSTRCSQMKNVKKLLKAGNERGFWLLSASGTKLADKLAATAQEPTSNSCEGCILQSLKSGGGEITATEMGKVIKDAGYTKSDLGEALKSLQGQQFITIGANGEDQSAVSATPAGKKYAKSL